MLTTCGTSLLTNSAKSEIGSAIRKFANTKQSSEIPIDTRQKIEEWIKDRKSMLLGTESLGDMQKSSAELNSLIRYYNGHLEGTQDQHFLLCTDTWLGHETAETLQQCLVRYFPCVQVHRFSDLQTGELAGFRLAMSELVKWSAEVLPGYRDSGYRIIFNLTGGFKSIQGFMQAIGMFYADESIYTFESGNELLSLPRLPISLDVESSIRNGLYAFRRAAIGLALRAEEIQGIPEIFFHVDEGQATLSPWGELAWQQVRKSVMGQSLLDPISTRLRFGLGFAKSVSSLVPDERYSALNERLDHLAKFLEKGVNLKTLDFKKLEGNPVPPSTHEIDAWADNGAPRLFGHYENGIFIVDKFGKHLPD
jgi:putative CRISPR-associated protein (TIGR02619 family)